MHVALRFSRFATTRPIVAQLRTAATHAQKRAGDISDAFQSLSGQQFAPLAPQYAELKGRLIKGREDAIRESWERLLRDLREEIPIIVELGSKVVPEIDFKDIGNASESFKQEHRKRGVAVVRGVVPEEEALQWKEELREYIQKNPHTKGTSIHPNTPASSSPPRTSKPSLEMSRYSTDSFNSLPRRQPASLRALLVPPPAPSPSPPPAPPNSPLPNVLLAQRRPLGRRLNPAPNQLRRPATDAAAR